MRKEERRVEERLKVQRLGRRRRERKRGDGAKRMGPIMRKTGGTEAQRK